MWGRRQGIGVLANWLSLATRRGFVKIDGGGGPLVGPRGAGTSGMKGAAIS